jgi:hypothetical protein
MADMRQTHENEEFLLYLSEFAGPNYRRSFARSRDAAAGARSGG